MRARTVQPTQILLDILAEAAEGGLVKGAALAHERRLLEERLGLGHFLEQREVD